MSLTHQSAVVVGPRLVRLDKQITRNPAAHEVRVRLEGCGVCGSNLPIWEGRPWFKYPLDAGAPGHEGWGVVDRVGPDVNGISEGDRVALLTQNAFSEVEIADQQRVVALPAGVDGMDFPGEALACAMNVFKRAEIQKGQRVAVIGVGFLGALLVQLAEREGAEVIALSRRPTSLEAAHKMGAAHIIPMEDHHAIIEEVGRLTGGELCERVIEATGSQWPLDLGAELCAERGRLVIAGYHQDGPRQVNMQLWNWRGLDVINAHERDPMVYIEGMRSAVEAIFTGRLRPESLYTHHFPLEKLSDALDLLGSRDGTFMKGLISYA